MANRSPVTYKVLVTLLYADLSFISRYPDGYVEIKTSKLSRHFACSAPSLREALYFLERCGYISNLSLGAGWARLKMNKPKFLCQLVCGGAVDGPQTL